MNLNNFGSEVSEFPGTDKYKMIVPQFETMAFAFETPKELYMNNPAQIANGSGDERDKITSLLFEKLAFAPGTPNEFNFNNPGLDGFQDQRRTRQNN